MDRNLLAFIKVFELGNLSAAADDIGLAQPSLTKRLKQLEDEYQTHLFARVPHGMVPTDFGNTLYAHAKSIEQQHLQAHEAIKARQSGHLEIIRIGAGPIVRSYMMRDLIEGLAEDFAGTRFEFREDVHSRNLPLLKNGDLDIVFGAISDKEEDEDIRSYQIATLTLGMMAHQSHPLFAKANINAHDLALVPWVHHADDGVAGQMIEGYYARNGLEVPKFAVRTTSLEFGMELISNGVYIMPASVELTRAFRSFGIAALPLEAPMDHFPIGAYVRASSLAFPAINRLLEIAADLAQSQNLDGHDFGG